MWVRSALDVKHAEASARYRRAWRLAPVVELMCAMSAGCSPGEAVDDASPPAASPAPSEVPAIYVDSVLEVPADDGNKEQEDYRFRLEACEAGNRPTTRLTSDELVKLGTKRLQRWWGGDRAAVRMEEWVLGSGSLKSGEFCKFYLASRGRHTYFDQSGTVTLRLHDGSTETAGAETHWRFNGPARAEDPTVRKGREQRRGAPSQQTVAGQPCEQWSLEHATVCTWTAGRQWGFSDSPPSMMATTHQSHLMGRVVLAQEPRSNGVERIETREFVVGGTLDDAAMRPRAATAWPAGKPRYE